MPSSDNTNDDAPNPRFETTQWSLVLRAGRISSSEGKTALSELCQRYWYPLYAHIRSRGNDSHQAEDLTQGFFERVIDKNYLSEVDPAKGKFRTFLLSSLTNFLANEHDRATALKRGGDKKLLSLDIVDAERRLAFEPSCSNSLEANFMQKWTCSLLERVLNQLQEEFIAANDGETFDKLKQFLTAGESDPMNVVAEELKMTPATVRVTVHRLRTRYRQMLRREIAATLDNPAEVDEEISALFEAFSK